MITCHQDITKDSRAQSTQVEWWYLNGFLKEDNSDNEWSFSYALFKFDHDHPIISRIFPRKSRLQQMLQVHFNLSHLSYESSYTDIRQGLHIPLVAKFNKTELNNRALHSELRSISRNQFILKVNGKRPSLKLCLSDQKGVLYNGQDGLIRMGETGESGYYSYPSLSLYGTLKENGQTARVTGQAWMDHQWGQWNTLETSWSWFSFQLNTNVQVMVYTFYNMQGKQLNSYVSIMDEHGFIRHADRAEIHEQKSFLSKETGVSYPTECIVSFPGGQFVVQAMKDQQEICSSIGNYWEGPVRVAGILDSRTVSGKGFAEFVKRYTKNS